LSTILTISTLGIIITNKFSSSIETSTNQNLKIFAEKYSSSLENTIGPVENAVKSMSTLASSLATNSKAKDEASLKKTIDSIDKVVSSISYLPKINTDAFIVLNKEYSTSEILPAL
jgi:hypothetical protein